MGEQRFFPRKEGSSRGDSLLAGQSGVLFKRTGPQAFLTGCRSYRQSQPHSHASPTRDRSPPPPGSPLCSSARCLQEGTGGWVSPTQRRGPGHRPEVGTAACLGSALALWSSRWQREGHPAEGTPQPSAQSPPRSGCAHTDFYDMSLQAGTAPPRRWAAQRAAVGWPSRDPAGLGKFKLTAGLSAGEHKALVVGGRDGGWSDPLAK